MTTVLITGANRGIGFEHARRFAQAGSRVYAAARDPVAATDLQDLAKAHPGAVEIIAYDAADPAAPQRVAAALNGAPLDILFNNAGVYGGDAQSLAHIDEVAFLETLRVNTLAPLQLTRALVENLAVGDRKLVVNQSSRMGSIADNGSGGFYAYRAAKAALNMVTRSLAADLRPRGIAVLTMHPGWVRTRMGGPNAPVDVADCVAGQQAIMARAGLAESGRFFDYTGAELPW